MSTYFQAYSLYGLISCDCQSRRRFVGWSSWLRMKGFRRRWSFLSRAAACHGSDIDDNTKRSCDKKNYLGQNIMIITSTSSFTLTKLKWLSWCCINKITLRVEKNIAQLLPGGRLTKFVANVFLLEVKVLMTWNNYLIDLVFRIVAPWIKYWKRLI